MYTIPKGDNQHRSWRSRSSTTKQDTDPFPQEKRNINITYYNRLVQCFDIIYELTCLGKTNFTLLTVCLGRLDLISRICSMLSTSIFKYCLLMTEAFFDARVYLSVMFTPNQISVPYSLYLLTAYWYNVAYCWGHSCWRYIRSDAC